MILRDYQQSCIDSIVSYFSHNSGNPIAVLPTGAGKSLIAAAIVDFALSFPNQRILVLSHVKELIEQNYKRLKAYKPDTQAGIYSAGLGRKDIMYPVTVASIQSIYKKANLFGHIDLCILDECHLLSPNQDGMYSSFFEDLKKTNPNLKVIGLTATPWREKGGLLTECTFFDDICYNLPIATLIKRNFLSPLVSKSSVVQADTAGIKITAGDFNKGELAKRMDNEALTREAVKELLRYGKSRKKWLIFCSSVEHAHHVSDELNANGIKSSGISGKTPDSERDAILARYQQGDLQAVTNYGVLTTGFDAPETDLVSLLRPTKSAGLYIQMLGRGMRIADGKKDCLVLDFGGNIERFGPVDKIAIKEKSVRKGDTISVQPTKICPNCRSDCHALNLSCPECGYEFNDRVNRLKIEAQASNRSVMSEPPREYNVRNVRYEKHSKIGKPDSVRAEYDCGIKTFKEWVCFDHQGYARKKARQWWFERCQGLIPESVDEALRRVSELSSPKKIKVDENSKYAEIVGYEY